MHRKVAPFDRKPSDGQTGAKIVARGRYGGGDSSAGGACSYSSPSEKLRVARAGRAKACWQPCRPCVDERRQPAQRCRPIPSLHQAALKPLQAENRGRPRPEILRNLRPVELKNALRSGDIWVQGSRRLRLRRLPAAGRESSPHSSASRPALPGDQRTATYGRRLQHWTSSWPPSPARPGQRLPDAILTESGLKITPLDDAAVPDRAQALIDKPASCCRASRSPNC